MQLLPMILAATVIFVPVADQPHNSITVKIERPIGVDASGFVRYV